MAERKLKCPECPATFGRPQVLGAHRFREHGVVGAHRAKRASSRRGPKTATKTATALPPAVVSMNGDATHQGGTVAVLVHRAICKCDWNGAAQPTAVLAAQDLVSHYTQHGV